MPDCWALIPIPVICPRYRPGYRYRGTIQGSGFQNLIARGTAADGQTGHTNAKPFVHTLLVEIDPYKPLLLEMEALSPLNTVREDKGHIFVMDKYAARVFVPRGGHKRCRMIAPRMKLEDGRIRGAYGVFYETRANLVFNMGAIAETWRVSPRDSLVLDTFSYDTPPRLSVPCYCYTDRLEWWC